MRRAYSLIRFSSWKQVKGQSKRRQMEWGEALCLRNGWHLDTSLRCEKPVSGFRGQQRKVGPLAEFLAGVEQGRVTSGSILLVESLDRMGREEMDEALYLFLGILRAGVEIATMEPERVYTKASINDKFGIFEAIIIMSRAHEESAIKSKRLSDVWTQRRKNAGIKPMSGNAPAWLKLRKDRTGWLVDEDKAEVVRQIFRWCVEGHGLHVICQMLTARGIPPLARAKHWVVSYVSLILRNRAVLGEFMPHVKKDGKRIPTGVVHQDYYPRIIEDDLFYAAQKGRAGRKLQTGPRGRHVRNLFTGLLRDARDGCTMVTVSESDSNRTVKLVSSGACRGRAGSHYRTIAYPLVERAFLATLEEITVADLVGGPVQVSAVPGLEAKLAGVEERLQKVAANLDQYGDFDAGIQLLRSLEEEKKLTLVELEKAKAEAASPVADALAETQAVASVLCDAEGEELASLRTRLKARIRDVVESMWLVIFGPRKSACGCLQIHFKNKWRTSWLGPLDFSTWPAMMEHSSKDLREYDGWLDCQNGG